jgi:hypothetical protein
MSVTREDKVSLDLLLHMTSTFANTILNQVLKLKKDKRSSQTQYSKNILLVLSLSTKSIMMVVYQSKFSSTEMVSVIQWESKSFNMSSNNSTRLLQRSMNLTSRLTKLQTLHWSLSTKESDKDSLRSKVQTSLTPLKEPILIKDLLNNQRLLMVNLTSSLCLTQLHKVQLNRLTSMLLRIPQKSLRMPSWTSPMLCATTITIGMIQLKCQLLACWPTRLLSIGVKLETYLQV